VSSRDKRLEAHSPEYKLARVACNLRAQQDWPEPAVEVLHHTLPEVEALHIALAVEELRTGLVVRPNQTLACF
jgi:hypothetical protein